MLKTASQKYWLVAVFIIIIGCLFIWIDYRLDVVLNKSGSSDRTEIMLWDSYDTFVENQYKFDFNIQPDRKSVNVRYRIINASDKPIDIKNTINFAVVNDNGSKLGDPGNTVWRLSETDRRISQQIHIKSNGVFQDEVSIDREKINFNGSQYYIDAFFNGERISRYKIIEGLKK